MPEAPRLTYPDGHSFAFTILDDTDDTHLENGPPIYELLRDLGLRTTKTVWPLATPPDRQGPYHAGLTLADPGYLEWVRRLADEGFEIASHGTSMGSSERERTIEGMDLLQSEFGPIRVHCNHGENLENLYWGAARYGSWSIRTAYGAWARLSGASAMTGHDPASRHFWGDVAYDRFTYVRGFTFNRLNCRDIPPGRAYHDPRKPFVRFWFNTADAPDVSAFKELVTPRTIDELATHGGWTIVSTHLGKGFVRARTIDGDVRRTLEYLASLGGWFVPVGQLLDHLRARLGANALTWREQVAMEIRHVLDRLASAAP